jgi:hypothetical protein
LPGGDVIERGLRDLVHRLAREKRLVGGHDDVREHQQTREHVVLQREIRMAFEEETAFFLVDVEAQMAKLAVLQCTDQRIAFDESAAPRVDQHRAALHFGQRGGVDQMVGGRHQRTVQLTMSDSARSVSSAT